MATRSELITKWKRLPAFRGLSNDDIDAYLDLALEAVESYAPKRVKMKNIPTQSSGCYDVPEGAKTLLGAFIVDTNIRIEYREEETPAGERTYQLLQIQVPSYLDVVREQILTGNESYPTPFSRGHRYGSFIGGSYDQHDLEYSTAVAVEDLQTRQLLALRLYAESEAYIYQATKSENRSDITDREASGASTTLRRSQSGNAFQKLSERCHMRFVKEVARPYFGMDTFGLTEYIFKED